MADQDAGHPTPCEPVAPEVRDRPMAPEVRDQLRSLIVAELGVAWDAAVTAGADPEALAEIVEERRRRIQATSAATDDPSH